MTTKPKPKPFELVPGPPPAEPLPPAKPERRPLMTADVKIEHDGLVPTPPRRGPQVGERQMSDGDFIAQNGTAEELARFRAEIQARRARDAKTWVFQKCDVCGIVLRVRPGASEGERCPRNMQGRVDGGHMFTMSEEEANAYLFNLAKTERAAVEQMRQRAYRANNAERANHGLEPLTFTEYRRQAEAEYRLMIERQRELGTIAKQAREEREARERQQAVENAK